MPIVRSKGAYTSFSSERHRHEDFTQLSGAAEARRAHNPEDNGSKPF